MATSSSIEPLCLRERGAEPEAAAADEGNGLGTDEPGGESLAAKMPPGLTLPVLPRLPRCMALAIMA